MAVWRRRPKDVIHHSDRGSRYMSYAFGKRCREAGVRPSAGSVGDAQCDVRELLRDAGVRTAGPQPVPQPGRGEAGGVRLHRGVLQPNPQALGAGVRVVGGLREEACGLSRRGRRSGRSRKSIRCDAGCGGETGAAVPASAAGCCAPVPSVFPPAAGPGGEDGEYILQAEDRRRAVRTRRLRDVGCPRPEKLSSPAAGRRRETE